MAKSGGEVLRIIRTAASMSGAGRVGGKNVVLVGDTDDLKGTQGDPGPTGPPWEPTVANTKTLDIAGGPIGYVEIEVSAGVTGYLPVYAEDEA